MEYSYYLSGLLAGALSGWVLGQMWQSWNDHALLRVIFNKDPLEDLVVVDSDDDPIEDDLMGSITQMFEEEMAIRNKKLHKMKPCLHTKKGGGYVTNNELDSHNSKYQNSEPPKLSRSDELEIMQTFAYIIGMPYIEACAKVKEQGYMLHPIYINDLPKKPAGVFSKTTLGVRVKDPELEVKAGGLHFSHKATVMEIMDVGGKDHHNRGKSLRQSRD